MGARTEEQGQGLRFLVSARVLIHEMGALAIFNGDARGPDDYSVGFNPHLPTSGQVGTYSLVFVTRACGESQSQPEQPQRRGPGLLKLSRGVTSPQNQDFPRLSPKTGFVGGGFFWPHCVAGGILVPQRDGTHAPQWSAESQPLDCQASPQDCSQPTLAAERWQRGLQPGQNQPREPETELRLPCNAATAVTTPPSGLSREIKPQERKLERREREDICVK